VKIHSMFPVIPGKPKTDNKKGLLSYIDISVPGSNTKKRILIADKLASKLKEDAVDNGFFADFEVIKSGQHFMLFPASKGVDSRLLVIGGHVNDEKSRLPFCEIIESDEKNVKIHYINETPRAAGFIIEFKKEGAYVMFNDYTIYRLYKGYCITRRCSSAEEADAYLAHEKAI
jgi:hypothetical protein